MTSRRALVTGASGFIGGHVARGLQAAGFTVRALVRTPDVPEGMETAVGSMEDPASLERAMSGVDQVFHFAAYSDVSGSIRDPQRAFLSGEAGTFHLLEACRKADVSRFVYCSTARVYGDPDKVPIVETDALRPKEPYGVTKLAGELWVNSYHATYGMPISIIRPFSVYGPGRLPKPGTLSGAIPLFVTRALRGEPLRIVGDGSQTKDFTYVSDVVDGVLTVAGSPDAVGRTFNMGAGRGVSIRDLADRVLELTGSASTVEYLPPSQETVSNYSDCSLAREVLGWQPRVGIDEGLRNYIAWAEQATA